MFHIKRDYVIKKETAKIFISSITFFLTFAFVLASSDNSTENITNSSQLINELTSADSPPSNLNTETTYFDFIQRFIQENPNQFSSSEQLIHSGDYFASLIREIRLDGDNFTSFERSILLYSSVDNDLDGYITYTYNDMNNQPNVDCNDREKTMHPGAQEMCNGVDDNCDGKIDEGSCQCNDGLDNDKDFSTDKQDPGCWLDSTNPASYSFSMNSENKANAMCTQDSDCGDDGFIGKTYCINEDIYRNYESHICQNKGKANAECARDVSKEFVKSCLYGCDEGRCLEYKEALKISNEIKSSQISSQQTTESDIDFVKQDTSLKVTQSNAIIKKQVNATNKAYSFYLLTLLIFAIIVESYLILLVKNENNI